MNDKAGKVLVVESGDSLREQIAAVLSHAGYEVSTDYRGGMKTVLAFEPDAVVLGADPPQLDCCDLLSEIKGSEHTHNIRVVMLSPGGSWSVRAAANSVARVRDDRFNVISLPPGGNPGRNMTFDKGKLQAGFRICIFPAR